MDWDSIEADTKELLDLQSGWERPILWDLGKLCEESGEVAECLVKSTKSKEDLGDELDDLLTVIAVIAMKSNISMKEAHARKQPARIEKALKKYHGGVYPKRSKKAKGK